MPPEPASAGESDGIAAGVPLEKAPKGIRDFDGISGNE